MVSAGCPFGGRFARNSLRSSESSLALDSFWVTARRADSIINNGLGLCERGYRASQIVYIRTLFLLVLVQKAFLSSKTQKTRMIFWFSHKKRGCFSETITKN